MRYFIHLGFDGGNFRGWQKQKQTSKTVQEVIERTLSKVLKQEISIYGCGRTDAGVHASQYVIQFYLENKPNFDLHFRLNKNLPNSIAVFEIFEVEEDQHCRYNATARTYDYFIHLHKTPFLVQYSSFYGGLKLDLDAMHKCTELIKKSHDFRALCKQPDLYRDTLCRVFNCQLFVNEDSGRLRFTITSNRFLRGMVRYCVFFLLEIGQGKLSIDEFKRILSLELTDFNKHPAMPNGLFLSKIEYPFLELAESHYLIKMLKQGLE